MARDGSAARRSALRFLVIERGFIGVSDAAGELGVSEVTIRGDLSALEIEGLVYRVHGGAIERRGGTSEPSLEEALLAEAASKRSIGAMAASLVASGQSILIDVGSTTLAVALALMARSELDDIAIITNGLSIALAIEPAIPRFSVLVSGGSLRPLQHSLVNPGASEFFESVHVDIAFIGCNGIDIDRGVTNINYPEAEVKRRMLLSAKRRVLVADGSKFGQTHLGVVGAIRDFDVLVTDEAASESAVSDLRAAGLEVVRAASAPQ
jgi:DeoR family transcriptional regulator of aga operon